MNRYTTTRVLGVVIMVAGVTGCDSNSPASKSFHALQKEFLSRDITGKGAHSIDSATKAVGYAREKLLQNDYVGAYDLMLAAIRLDPSSPEVFDATLQFTREAAQSDEDVALDLAHDLYVRTAGLIPFQPLSKTAHAREEYLKLTEVFEPATANTAPIPLEPIRARLAEIRRREIPSEVVSLAVRAIRSDLELVAVGVASDPSVPSTDFWQQWLALKDELEEFETEVLKKLYSESGERIAIWRSAAEKLLKDVERAQPQEFSSIGREVLAKINDGYRLRMETAPFVDAAIAVAKSDRDDLDKRLDRLERTREWMYNQHALSQVDFVRTSDLDPLAKLKNLANYDERRLSPYVFQRYQEEWNRSFEELDKDKKVEATKIRIFGGAIQ